MSGTAIMVVHYAPDSLFPLTRFRGRKNRASVIKSDEARDRTYLFIGMPEGYVDEAICVERKVHCD